MPNSFSTLARSVLRSGAGGWAATPTTASRQAGFIDLTVADSNLTPPEQVVARAVAALRAGDSRYPAVSGRPHVRDVIAQAHRRTTGRRASAENVLPAPGAQGALYLALLSIVGPDDHVLVVEPHYLNYPATIAATGAAVDYVFTDPDSDFRVTETAILAALRRNTKAIVLSNPNNPTGRFLSADEIGALTRVARQHDLWLICDEVYREVHFEGAEESGAAWESVDDLLITLSSLSKTHAMSGWRFGWIVAPSPFIMQATKLADVVFHGIPGFIQEAAAVALADAGAASRDAVGAYRRRRDAFAERLRDSAIAVRRPQAGLFTLCDVRNTGVSGAQFAQAAWAEAELAVVDGARFGPATAGFVRVALTAGEETLIEAADRMAGLARRMSERAIIRSARPGATQPASGEQAFAEGVYISPSGVVHVCTDGNLEGIF